MSHFPLHNYWCLCITLPLISLFLAFPSLIIYISKEVVLVYVHGSTLVPDPDIQHGVMLC